MRATDRDEFVLVDAARRCFHDVFGGQPLHVAVAPGRVNLIGEHTDYNDGFVFPMAIDRGIAVACNPRQDQVVRVHATLSGETRELAIGRALPASRAWDGYVAGVIWALRDAGFGLRGADLAIVSTLPVGAGLSSSAALELATARALCAVAGIDWEPVAMAKLARKAENEFVGVACGIMDQFASALGTAGTALLLDCRSLQTRLVAVPDGARIVVMDTGVRRSLATSAYNARQSACARALAAIQTLSPQARALRDADESLVSRARASMDEEAYRRACHVVGEIARPTAMAECFERHDLIGAGRLMNESHASLRDLYEVSCAELDAIVLAAQEHTACFGARLTGAGFGGCAIGLVATPDVSAFGAAVKAVYERQTGVEASWFVTTAAAGAHLIDSHERLARG